MKLENKYSDKFICFLFLLQHAFYSSVFYSFTKRQDCTSCKYHGTVTYIGHQ